MFWLLFGFVWLVTFLFVSWVGLLICGWLLLVCGFIAVVCFACRGRFVDWFDDVVLGFAVWVCCSLGMRLVCF